MRCPACGQELEDHGPCPNCSVAQPGPPADPTIELTPVFASGDPALIALAKSLLEGEGIDYLVRGEGVQDLFGGGRIGSGFNIVTGPAQFIVRDDDAQRARELLGDLSAAESD